VTGPRAQRGVAVVVAVLVVALATSTAAYILWHQSLWLRQVENITARAQADALARAAGAWAAAILAEDDPAIDHLGETWARRMPPFPAEHAELAGSIVDEQAKFNNLAGEGGANPRQLLAFQRLLGAVGLPAALGESVVDWLDADDAVTPPNGAEDQHYLALDPPYRAANRRIADLAELPRVKGFDARAVARLEPFVTALPVETPVNVNTAPPAVLRALLPGLAPEGDAPQAVRMLLAGSADAPDTGRWAESLHVPVLSSARGCPRRPTRRRPRARTSSRVRAADDGARRTSGRASGRRPS
jgi:general secretion pathway protein K